MSRIAFEREIFEAELLDPYHGFAPTRTKVEARRDPLTGHSARILPAGSFPPPARHDLERLAAETRKTCPFCAERIEEETPRLPPAVSRDGRIRAGEAVLFPNLVPYAKWSSVSVYSPERHLLSLPDLTPSLVAANLLAQRAFARAVLAFDPTSQWISVNANHLPPAGSSIFHPHLQGSANPLPTTMQRLLAAVPPADVRAYVAAERDDGTRLLASSGGIDWVASFAPLGPAEICAFAAGVGSPHDLEDALVDELARGISAVLGVYDRLGFQSFNLALYGVPAAQTLLLRIVARGYFGAAERSDAMWSERLQWEAATDLAPEHVAELARPAFARRG
jgi:UDPglucose--hexose-1-phosphate uridylyltransferase